jgi:hypothetical protein
MGASDMTTAPRALAVATPSLDRSIPIVVCIPCFRRPQHLRLTLESLAGQRTDRRFAVVIVDNDAAGCESAPVAAEFLRAGKFAGLCVIEPRQGIAMRSPHSETARATFLGAAHFLMTTTRSPRGLARADGAQRGSPGPIWSAGRCSRNSTTTASAGSVAILPFVRPTITAVRCRSSTAAAIA